MMTTLRLLTTTCTFALVLAVTTTAFGWSEDFETYTAGQNLTEGPNPNGWTALVAGESLQINANEPWSGGQFNSPDPPGIAVVGDFDGDLRLGANGWAAAKAALPAPDSDVETLEFLFTGSDSGRTSVGVELRDSVNGGGVSVHTDYAVWVVDADSVPRVDKELSGVLIPADYNAYDKPDVQRITLTLDYLNDTVNLTAQADDGVTGIYNGNENWIRSSDPALDETGTGPYSIPANFSPDEIIIFAGPWGGNSDMDNITYSSVIPEPGSLVLLGLGTLLLMFRRRRR